MSEESALAEVAAYARWSEENPPVEARNGEAFRAWLGAIDWMRAATREGFYNEKRYTGADAADAYRDGFGAGLEFASPVREATNPQEKLMVAVAFSEARERLYDEYRSETDLGVEPTWEVVRDAFMTALTLGEEGVAVEPAPT